MDIINGDAAIYADALKKLFPRGKYWDEQLGPAGDLSLYCQVQADEVVRFRGRMQTLLSEARPETAEETIGKWEQVYTGSAPAGKTVDERRQSIFAQKITNITKANIQSIAQSLGITVSSIVFPYTPACFGFSKFGSERMGSPAVLSVIYIYVEAPAGSDTEEFEMQVTQKMLANQLLFFFYV